MATNALGMILGVDGGYILLAVNEIKEGTREQFSDVFQECISKKERRKIKNRVFG